MAKCLYLNIPRHSVMVYMKNIYFYEIPAQFNSIELKDNSANGSVTFSIYIYIYLFLKKNKIFTSVDFLCCVFVKNNFN